MTFMRISPEKSGPRSAKSAEGASLQPVFSRILHWARRSAFWLAALSACVGMTALASAQEERPQITPGERKVPRKKEAGPRALGILQLAANGKATLIPLAILINGKFWDASVYKADPIPMALDTGTIYEGERTGSSQGLFTVGSALHSNAANAPSPWIGTGKWLPAGTEEASKSLKAEAAPVGIDTMDEAPRLTKNPAAAKPAPPASSSPPPASKPSGDSGGDGPPRLSKPAPASAPSSSPGTAPSGGSAPAPGSAPSSSPGAKSAEAKPEDHAKGPESDSGATEGNRPRLRRGKPVEDVPDDEVPGYSKPGTKAATSTDKTSPDKTPVAAADKAPVQLIPAISDASGPEPRSYTFEWLKGEEGERREQMLALAKAQLLAYLSARAGGRITVGAPGSKAARSTVARRFPDPVFENVRMIAYDLWTNNQPVIVFSAEAHLSPPPAGSPQTADSQLQYSIVLVARTDIYSNLAKLYVGITDKYHLDLTPRLELIDAVDADGDGRGELLFRETSDQGTGWVVYRATVDKLWKMYDSLNPE